MPVLFLKRNIYFGLVISQFFSLSPSVHLNLNCGIQNSPHTRSLTLNNDLRQILLNLEMSSPDKPQIVDNFNPLHNRIKIKLSGCGKIEAV